MITQKLFSGLFARMIKNKEKVNAYISNLGTWETRLNDETRMLINSIKGSVNAEKFINKQGNINVKGVIEYVKERHPKFYNSKMFQQYNNRVIYLQGKIRHEKEVINKHTRWFNEDLQKHSLLCGLWGFERIPYEVWNYGRDVELATGEYNKLNQQQF